MYCHTKNTIKIFCKYDHKVKWKSQTLFLSGLILQRFRLLGEMISLNTLQIELITITAYAGNYLYCWACIPDTPIQRLYSCIDIYLGNGKPNGWSMGSTYSYASELISSLKKTGPYIFRLSTNSAPYVGFTIS
jgi:hypothetical protein